MFIEKSFAKIATVELFAILVLFSVPEVFAHEPGDIETAEGFKMELTPAQVIQGDSIPVEVHITKGNEPVIGLKVIFTIDKHDIGLTEKFETSERDPGHYFTKYKFANSGMYEVHVGFLEDGKEIRKTVNIDVVPTGLSNEIIFVVGAVISLAVVWLFGLKGKKKRIKNSLIVSVIILVITGLGYSVYTYQTAGAAEKGIIICSQEDPNLCNWQAHIHVFVMQNVCGEEKIFPTEVGDLDKQHTHEEKNVIHWHSSVSYDKDREKIIDESVLKLGNFFDSIDIKFSDKSFYDYSDGQACPDGSIGKLKMFTNKNGNWQQNFDFGNYVWSDKNVIYLAFDSRTDGEVLDFLKSSKIEFPTLGFG